jgi:hypothetical protein
MTMLTENLRPFLRLLILSAFLISSLGIAGESVVLEKGTPAPFTGILMNQSLAQSNQAALLELDLLRRSISIYKDNYKISEDQVAYWRKSALDASSELEKRHNRRFLENTGYFAVGATVTILLAFAVNSATK